MPWSIPNSVSLARRSSLDAVASTMPAPAALAGWLAARPAPAGPEVAELEQAVVGRPELDRHRRGVLDGEAVRDGVGAGGRHRHLLGVAARGPRGDAPRGRGGR